MPAYPSSEDREWLDDELKGLLARVGSDRFVRGPILEPDDRFFPDRFVEGPRGVRTVARRLLAWAGLDELGVEVIDESPADDARRIKTWALELAGVEPGYVTLALLARGKPEHLPGALAPLLALAARAHMGLDHDEGAPYRGSATTNDPELEAQLAGITSVELGWGLLALNAAQRHHTAGEVVGNWHSYEVATEEHGALPIPELAYLLALQLVVRGTSEAEHDRLRALLQPNQEKLVREWVAALVDQRDALIERLAIGPEERWPQPRPVAPEPFEEEGDEGESWVAEEAAEPERWNFDRPIFRVREVRYGSWGIVGALSGGLLATALLSAGILEGPLWFFLTVPLGIAAGAVIAPKRAYDRCSDPDCEAPLGEQDARCARCGGHVAGRIRSASRRLEAEEALGVAWYRERGLPVPSSLEDEHE